MCTQPSFSGLFLLAFRVNSTMHLSLTTCVLHFLPILFSLTRWGSWLRHWATSLKVAGSIPDGVIAIFHLHNPSGRTMAEMSTRNISRRVKMADRVGLTTLQRSCADCHEIWEPQAPGTLRACTGL
jgi:hypothetical protein